MNNLITSAYYMLLLHQQACLQSCERHRASVSTPCNSADLPVHSLQRPQGARKRPGGGCGREGRWRDHSRIAPDQQDTLERWKVIAGLVLLWCHFICLSLGGVLELVSPFPQMALTALCGVFVLVFLLFSNLLSCLLYLTFSLYYYEYVTFKLTCLFLSPSGAASSFVYARVCAQVVLRNIYLLMYGVA